MCGIIKTGKILISNDWIVVVTLKYIVYFICCKRKIIYECTCETTEMLWKRKRTNTWTNRQYDGNDLTFNVSFKLVESMYRFIRFFKC